MGLKTALRYTNIPSGGKKTTCSVKIYYKIALVKNNFFLKNKPCTGAIVRNANIGRRGVKQGCGYFIFLSPVSGHLGVCF